MEYVRSTWAMKTAMFVLIILSSTLYGCVSATNYTVGDGSGWDLTSDLHSWTSNKTFSIGDTLEFKYGPTHDVLEVNEDSFSTCQINNPISTHNGGNTLILLDKPGTRYFICGTNGHCNSGLKLQVDVQSPGNSSGPQKGKKPPPSPLKRRPPPPQAPSPPHHGDTPLLPFSPPPGPTQVPTSGALRQITSLLLLPLIMTALHVMCIVQRFHEPTLIY